MPVILPCMCVICKGCALEEEAKAQQQQQPAAGKGKQLLLDVALMKRVGCSDKAADKKEEIPLCGICEKSN